MKRFILCILLTLTGCAADTREQLYADENPDGGGFVSGQAGAAAELVADAKVGVSDARPAVDSAADVRDAGLSDVTVQADSNLGQDVGSPEASMPDAGSDSAAQVDSNVPAEDAQPTEDAAEPDAGPVEDSGFNEDAAPPEDSAVPDAQLPQDSATPPVCDPSMCEKIGAAWDINPTQQQKQSDLDIIGRNCEDEAGQIWQTQTVCSNAQYCAFTDQVVCLPCDARRVDSFTTVELYKGKTNYEKLIDCQGCHCTGSWWYAREATCPDLPVIQLGFSSQIHGIVVTFSGSDSFSAGVLSPYSALTTITYSELISFTREAGFVKASFKVNGWWKESPAAVSKPYELNARLTISCS